MLVPLRFFDSGSLDRLSYYRRVDDRLGRDRSPAAKASDEPPRRTAQTRVGQHQRSVPGQAVAATMLSPMTRNRDAALINAPIAPAVHRAHVAPRMSQSPTATSMPPAQVAGSPKRKPRQAMDSSRNAIWSVDMVATPIAAAPHRAMKVPLMTRIQPAIRRVPLRER